MDVHGQQWVSMSNAQSTTVGPNEGGRQKDDALWKVPDVADFLNVSQQTIRRRIKAGAIPYLRVGGLIRFVPSDVREWVEQQEAA